MELREKSNEENRTPIEDEIEQLGSMRISILQEEKDIAAKEAEERSGNLSTDEKDQLEKQKQQWRRDLDAFKSEYRKITATPEGRDLMEQYTAKEKVDQFWILREQLIAEDEDRLDQRYKLAKDLREKKISSKDYNQQMQESERQRQQWDEDFELLRVKRGNIMGAPESEELFEQTKEENETRENINRLLRKQKRLNSEAKDIMSEPKEEQNRWRKDLDRLKMFRKSIISTPEGRRQMEERGLLSERDLEDGENDGERLAA